jgi:hypothetical protein
MGEVLKDWVKATRFLLREASRGYRSKEELDPELLELVPKVADPPHGMARG